MNDIVISSSLENYLETIYMLSLKHKTVRITDVAKELSISKPSANRAVNALKAQGLVEHEPYSHITLTDEGSAFAEGVYTRHLLLKKFLQNVLAVEPHIAEKEAGMIEHSLSQETVNKLEYFVDEYLNK